MNHVWIIEWNAGGKWRPTGFAYDTRARARNQLRFYLRVKHEHSRRDYRVVRYLSTGRSA